MKKRTAALLTAVIVTATATPVKMPAVYGAEPLPAGPPAQAYTYFIEDEEIRLPVYLIDGNLCIAVRAFAGAMGYHAELAADLGNVQIVDGLTGNEEAELDVLLELVKEEGLARISPYRLAYGANAMEATMYEVKGYNFVPLSTAAQFFGRNASLDEATGAVTIGNDPLTGADDGTLKRYADYVQEHGIPLDLDRTDKLETAGFEDYKVFFVGENHATKINYDLQLYWIKYFHENFGVRHIIRETGYCEAMLENRFLETGDESIIQMSLAGAKGSASYNKELYQFLLGLYEYNKSLPDEEKLVMVGIDVQHTWDNGVYYIKSLLEKMEAPADAAPAAAPGALPPVIAEQMSALEEAADLNEAKEALAVISGDEVRYKEYLGDDYRHFVHGIRSLNQVVEYWLADSDFEVREPAMKENFRVLYEDYDMDITFGMLGGAHVNLTGSFGAEINLAQFVEREYPPTAGKLCAIIIDYNNCYYMDSQRGADTPISSSHSKIVSDIMAAAFTNDAILIPLEKENSVFVEHKFSPAFSYYLSVKNSPAVTPYGELQ